MWGWGCNQEEYETSNYGSTFVLIVVLFILLVIVGAVFYQ